MQFVFTPGRLQALTADGTVAGEVACPPVAGHAGRFVVERVFVAPAFRGTGLAGQLVQQLVNHAREAGWTLKLLCPYAVAQFKKHPEYQELLLPQDRYERE